MSSGRAACHRPRNSYADRRSISQPRRDLRARLDACYHACHLVGSFTLRSGRTATEYFDKYQFEADPVLLEGVAQRMAPLVPTSTEVLAGLEMGGIAIVTALSAHHRASRRVHPQAGQALWHRPPGRGRGRGRPRGHRHRGRGDVRGPDRVVDRDLRELGATVNVAVCAIDREEGGAEALAAEGIALRAALTGNQLRAAG